MSSPFPQFQVAIVCPWPRFWSPICALHHSLIWINGVSPAHSVSRICEVEVPLKYIMVYTDCDSLTFQIRSQDDYGPYYCKTLTTGHVMILFCCVKQSRPIPSIFFAPSGWFCFSMHPIFLLQESVSNINHPSVRSIASTSTAIGFRCNVAEASIPSVYKWSNFLGSPIFSLPFSGAGTRAKLET